MYRCGNSNYYKRLEASPVLSFKATPMQIAEFPVGVIWG